MSIEWNSLILGGNELKTAGPATKNARRAVSTDAQHEQQRSTTGLVVWTYVIDRIITVD